MRKIRRFVRPAQRGKRPQSRAEPRVERIRVLMQMMAAAMRASIRRFACDDGFPAVRTIPRRDAMAPPKLAADAPVFDILHPIVIDLLQTFGDKLGFPAANYLDCRLGQRLHLHKPLLRDARFNRAVAAVARTNVVSNRLNADQEPLFL